MLYNKYRPQIYSEVVGQEEVIKNLIAQSKRDNFFNVYILCGQYGSGKTTVGRIIGKAANCEHKDADGNPCGVCESCRSIRDGVAPDVQEIAAAVNTGVDKVREICDNVAFLPVALRKKVYIIDEVQALSKAAFQAFLKMLEEPPEHAIFILATTDVGAIPPTVRSRAATYYFKQLTQAEIAGHLRKVSSTEGFSITEDTFSVIAKYSQGSMRNALSLLDMATQDGTGATGEKVEKLLGVSTPDSVFKIICEVLAGNAANIITELNKISEGGADLSVLVSDMLNAVSDLTVASVSLESVGGTEHYLSLIKETVALGSSVKFSAIADELFKAKQIMAKSPELSILTASLVRLSRRSDVVEYKECPGEDVATLRSLVSALETKLRKLEESISHGVVVNTALTPVTVCENADIAGGCVPEVATELYSAEECVLGDVAESDTVEVPVMEPELIAEKEIPVVYAEESVSDNEVTTEISEAVDDTEEEEDLFSFLGISSSQPKSDCPAMNNQRELERNPLYEAIIECCKVQEEGDSIRITSEFPVVLRAVRSCVSAYGTQGYDTAGIVIG